MEESKLLHGFRVLKKTFVPEVDSEVWEMQHEKSGARLIFMGEVTKMYTCIQ